MRPASSARAFPPVARVVGLRGRKLLEADAAVLLQRERGLRREADRRERERERMHAQLPALERAGIGEPRLLVLVANVEHDDTAVSADEVVAPDREPATLVGDL